MSTGKVTTVKFDASTAERIERLKAAYFGASNSDVIRLALQVLDKALTAQRGQSDLAFVDRQVKGDGIMRYHLPFDPPEEQA